MTIPDQGNFDGIAAARIAIGSDRFNVNLPPDQLKALLALPFVERSIQFASDQVQVTIAW